ncbi:MULTISPECIES: hypothetical protein [Sphingobacterium]|uniref:hypothetical protein n=1 Tax=Sphingobacterium TaxID=28453 RepID=UPI000EE8A3A1|nr:MULTISPECIES: hypothetical protein [Sphingobacterium]HAK29359.1 hypothetical protein [Sphingobacterium sp.]
MRIHEEISNGAGISPEEIKRGTIESIRKTEDGSFVYHFYRLPGFCTILGFDDKLIGWHADNDSPAYIDFKKEFLINLDIEALKVFGKNKEKDLDIVFDGASYIDLNLINPPHRAPIVLVMLYSEDAKMIARKLGYPVINHAQLT